MKALERVLQLTGDISESSIRNAIGVQVMDLIQMRSHLQPVDDLVVKASREEAVRSRLRAASTEEEIKSCIELAESMKMSFEANLGRRKLLKFYPTE